MPSQKVHMQTQDAQRRYRPACQPEWAGAILTTTSNPAKVKCDLCRAHIVSRIMSLFATNTQHVTAAAGKVAVVV